VPATHMPWQVSGADVGGVPGSSLPSSRALGHMPQLIPRIIHQTFRTKRLPMAAKVLMRSWHEQNGYAWQARCQYVVTGPKGDWDSRPPNDSNRAPVLQWVAIQLAASQLF
jgi:hypothetical protein